MHLLELQLHQVMSLLFFLHLYLKYGPQAASWALLCLQGSFHCSSMREGSLLHGELQEANKALQTLSPQNPRA